MRTNSESVFLEFFLPFLRTMCVYIQKRIDDDTYFECDQHNKI